MKPNEFGALLMVLVFAIWMFIVPIVVATDYLYPSIRSFLDITNYGFTSFVLRLLAVILAYLFVWVPAFFFYQVGKGNQF